MQVMSRCLQYGNGKGQQVQTLRGRTHQTLDIGLEVSDGLLVKSKTSFYRHCGNWGYLGRREVENSKTFDKIEDQHSRLKIED